MACCAVHETSCHTVSYLSEQRLEPANRQRGAFRNAVDGPCSHQSLGPQAALLAERLSRKRLAPPGGGHVAAAAASSCPCRRGQTRPASASSRGGGPREEGGALGQHRFWREGCHSARAGGTCERSRGPASPRLRGAISEAALSVTGLREARDACPGYGAGRRHCVAGEKAQERHDCCQHHLDFQGLRSAAVTSHGRGGRAPPAEHGSGGTEQV